MHFDVVLFSSWLLLLFQFNRRCQDIIFAEWCSAVANTRDEKSKGFMLYLYKRGNLSEVEIGNPEFSSAVCS